METVQPSTNVNIMDVIDLKDFYASGLGTKTKRLVGHRLGAFWQDLSGLCVAGLGYALPYLNAWHGHAVLAAGLMPARLGVMHWPKQGPYSVCLVDETDMPLPDASLDRVLIVHGLEMTDAPEDMLSEVWRILKPGGRLLVVVPNRRGVWARFDHTPFGHGRPFSRGQLNQYLSNAMFSPSQWTSALYVPPSSAAFFRRSAALWEHLGFWLWPGFAGVLIVEATKQVYALTPARRVRRAFRRFRPVLTPQPARLDGPSRAG